MAAVALAGCGGASAGESTSSPSEVTEVALTAEPAPPASAPRPAPSVSARRTAPDPRLPEPTHEASRADVEQARELFRRGIVAFESGDYAQAEASFRGAYALAPKAPILFNLGKVLLQEGKTHEACETFEHYWLSLRPPDPSKRSELPMSQCPNLATLP